MSKVSDATRRRAVALHLHGATNKELALELGVTPGAITQMMATEKWARMLDDVSAELDKQNIGKLRKLNEKAQAELLDRLTHGDEKLSKDGEIVRVKVPASNLVTVLNAAHDRVRLAEGKSLVNPRGLDLQSLAEAFAKLGAQAVQAAKTVQGSDSANIIESTTAKPLPKGLVSGG